MLIYPRYLSIVTLLLAYRAPCLPWFRNQWFFGLRYQGWTQNSGCDRLLRSPYRLRSYKVDKGRTFYWHGWLGYCYWWWLPIIWKSTRGCGGYHISDVVNWLTRGIDCNEIPRRHQRLVFHSFQTHMLPWWWFKRRGRVYSALGFFSHMEEPINHLVQKTAQRNRV